MLLLFKDGRGIIISIFQRLSVQSSRFVTFQRASVRCEGAGAGGEVRSSAWRGKRLLCYITTNYSVYPAAGVPVTEWYRFGGI